jgi:hypothetical protein
VPKIGSRGSSRKREQWPLNRPDTFAACDVGSHDDSSYIVSARSLV